MGKFVAIDKLHLIHLTDDEAEGLQKVINKLKQESDEPHISIWYDEIGTEIHFDDGGMFCRDFSGKDLKHFVTLMELIANHRWKDVVKAVEEWFINE